MNDEEKLAVCLEALRRIANNDPGPAYYIAKEALKEIEDEQ